MKFSATDVRDLLSDAFFDYDDGVLTISLPKPELRGPDAIDYSAWNGTWSRKMTTDEHDAIVAYIMREDLS